MGCGGSKEQEIVAYRVHRSEHSQNGHTDIRRSDAERYLATAPYPPAAGPKRYPKKYQNTERLFRNPNNIRLSEYPTRDYPYNQNAKGKAYRTSPGGTKRYVEPGYIRTVTDDHKNIQGVVNHPFGDPRGNVRAEEIMRRKRRR